MSTDKYRFQLEDIFLVFVYTVTALPKICIKYSKHWLWFCNSFAHENMKKLHSKVVYSTSKTTQSAQTVENSHSFFNVSHTWYKSLGIALVSRRKSGPDFTKIIVHNCNLISFWRESLLFKTVHSAAFILHFTKIYMNEYFEKSVFLLRW